MFTQPEKSIIWRVVQKKRTDLSIPTSMRQLLFSITNAGYVFSTEEKNLITDLLQDENKKLLLRPSTRKTITSALQKLKQTTRNENVNGISHLKPIRYKRK